VEQEYDTYGKEEAADLYGVSFEKLNDIDYLRELGFDAIEKAKATYLKHIEHKFSPQGCTLLFLLSESHLTMHCTPEHGFIALNCYTCGTIADPVMAIDYIIEQLEPDINRIRRKTTVRGNE
jgi:S-adenosylmethionine decarboxylase